MSARKKPLRATAERWTFKIITNNGEDRIESSGTIDSTFGECLRVLQIHAGRLSRTEMDTFVVLTKHITARLEESSREAVRSKKTQQ